MKTNILILGFGNLGRRYLQAITRIKIKKNIFIYDTIFKKETKNNYIDFFNKIYFCRDLKEIKIKKIDLCISAITSFNRLKSLTNVKKIFNIKNYIFEKVLEQNPENIKKLNLNFKGTNVWVNLPFNSMDFFNFLKKKITSKVFFVEVKGSNWGLASNIWHYTFFYGKLFKSKICDINFIIRSRFVKSKRIGFKEIIGGLTIKYQNGKSLILISNNKSSKLTIKHKIKNKLNKEICIADEIKNEIKFGNKKFLRKIPFLSNYMTKIIKNILNNESCDLPKLKEVYLEHSIIIKEFIKYFNKKNNSKIRNINIT